MTEFDIDWGSLATAGYGAAALLFFALMIAFLVARSESLYRKWLVAVTALTFTWLATAAVATRAGSPLIWLTQTMAETVAVAIWFVFLSQYVRTDGDSQARVSTLPTLACKAILVLAGAIVLLDLAAFNGIVAPATAITIHFIGHCLLAVVGFVVVEQIYRNGDDAQRWAVKYLCIAAGILAAYQLFLYSDAILYKRLDPALWIGRGLVLAVLAVPFGLGAIRGSNPERRIYISRDTVLHGVALTGSGIYLVAVAGVGFLIREGAGRWGTVAQVAFLACAGLLLLVLLFSGQVRAKTRVFLSKHLFAYRYDHRAEWLRLLTTLGDVREPDIRVRSIKALADIMDSQCSWLWTSLASGDFTCVAHWNRLQTEDPVVRRNDPLVKLLRDRQWVIDLEEMRHSPDRYDGLRAPEWIGSMEGAWVVVPLLHLGDLIGFAVLGDSSSRSDLNWEDHDLLRTAGKEISSHLALLAANDKLLQARQFEAFNRLSAYVVHDLKNLSAQLSLISSNAEEFKNDPEFIDDTLGTVKLAADKVDHMVGDLRKGLRPDESDHELISVREILNAVLQGRGSRAPVPVLEECHENLRVSGVAHRLQRVLGHVVQNAQEASSPDGEVRISATLVDDEVCIAVSDSGCGMDEQFIATRLFQPFDTTKGNAGMGIGVYETRQTIEEFGGHLSVESAPGVGTTFNIYLPLANEDDLDELTPVLSRSV